MKHRLSIITTYYNAQDYIIEAINSVMTQEFDTDFVEVEYVLVNDHTPDHSEDLIRDYLYHHSNPNIELNMITTPENLGCGGARKFGIDNSTGDYLMFLDADDFYINNDFIDRAIHEIVENDADLVEYGLKLNSKNKPPRNMVVKEKIVVENDGQNLEIMLFKENKIKFFVWTKILKKELAMSFPYSTLRTYEDVATIPVWLSNAKKVVIMPSVEINYSATENSIIRNNVLKTRLDTIGTIIQHCERFKDNKEILKAIYIRAALDLKAVLLNGHTSDDPGFNQMSKYNTYMLSFIYPDTYRNFTYNIDVETQIQKQLIKE